MSEPLASASNDPKQDQSTHFNMNKFQAVVCMAASAALSTGLLVLGFKALF
jgi:hypothetical protein